MINYFVINKSKEKSVLLIHGLYANAGFWLPYLSEFKKFRVIILSIDYISFLNNNCKYKLIENLLEDLKLENNLKAIISHSLGTIVSQNIITSKSTLKIEICPVYFSNRINNELFIDHLNSKISYSKNDIREQLLIVEEFINESIDSSFQNVVRYVPLKDDYFEYILNSNEKVYFEGDHFNIDFAIKDSSKLINVL